VQARSPLQVYAGVLRRAFELGVTFWDTAARYGTHVHVREALREVPRARVTLASKLLSVSAAEARAGVERALQEMGLERLDVVLMHEVDSLDDLRARRGALLELHRCRAEGLVGAVGLSTHAIEVLERAAGDPEIQVLFTNYNVAGLHMDASMGDYERALQRAFDGGQGVYVHKTLAEGRLAHRLEEALAHNLSRPFVHSVCVGFTSVAEVEQVVSLLQPSSAAPAPG
jgi:aryl-alcohol dehydrogenase-like predicted oxidoreductase